MLRDLRANRFFSLDPPEYYSDRIMVGSGTQAAVIAQFSIIDIFNSSTVGAPLLLYCFGLAAPTPLTVAIFPVRGHSASQGVTIPLDPNAPQLDGAIYFGSSATVNPAGFFAYPATATMTFWPYAFPLTSIPAGYSLRFEAQSLDIALTGSFLWLSTPVR